MEAFLEWISTLELSTGQVVTIVIFALYLLASAIGFGVTFAMGRGYLDLAKGLRKILEREQEAGRLGDISYLAGEISKYYASYAKYNPSLGQRYDSVINWMDDILLQTNMFTNGKGKKKKMYGIWFDEYYETLKAVQNVFEGENPFYRCSSGQIQILEDIRSLQNGDNTETVETVLRKTQEEFIRISRDEKKNERTNYISLAVGVAGILVSVLLTVLQMIG